MRTMPQLRGLTLCMLTLLFTFTSRSQGTFVNLNFELANVPLVPAGQFGGIVSVTNGVPGWAVYLGGTAQTLMAHNDVSLGGPVVAIYGPDWSSAEILQGSYTVSLQPSTFGPPTTVSIGQTGQIPQLTQSLRFYGNGAYTVAFGGQQIPVISLGTTAKYTLFGADISAYGNQTGELRFVGYGLLDNIIFSNQPIPEPSMGGLLLWSLLVIAAKRCGRA
jgi:hypothetical protein